MTSEDDDVIRESIPCVPVDVNDCTVFLPVGYWFDQGSVHVMWRGVALDVDKYAGIDGAWQHAVEREKAKRARHRASVNSLDDMVRRAFTEMPER